MIYKCLNLQRVITRHIIGYHRAIELNKTKWWDPSKGEN